MDTAEDLGYPLLFLPSIVWEGLGHHQATGGTLWSSFGDSLPAAPVLSWVLSLCSLESRRATARKGMFPHCSIKGGRCCRSFSADRYQGVTNLRDAPVLWQPQRVGWAPEHMECGSSALSRWAMGTQGRASGPGVEHLPSVWALGSIQNRIFKNIRIQ